MEHHPFIDGDKRPTATFEDDRLSGLIGHLYDAAIDDRLWAGMAARIAAAFDSTSTVMKLHGGDTRVRLVESTDNLVVPERLQDWATDWHRRDLWVERSVTFGMSRIVTDHDLVSEEERRRSGYYQEWLRALDIHHMIGAVFPVGGDTMGVLGVHRAQGAGGYDETDRRKAALLLPHLQRALRLGQKLAAARLTQTATLAALDRLDTGVLVVDRSGGIAHANALAEEILAASRDIGVLNGRLCVKRAALHDRLLSLIRASADIAAGRPAAPASALTIPREGRLPLTLTTAPFGAGATRFAHLPPRALVFLRDPEHPTLSAQWLCDLFGLTRTEAAIAVDLGRGRALGDIARRHGVGLATVRSHLKRILSKTGTNRQGEVIALIGRSVAALPDRTH